MRESRRECAPLRRASMAPPNRAGKNACVHADAGVTCATLRSSSGNTKESWPSAPRILIPRRPRPPRAIGWQGCSRDGGVDAKDGVDAPQILQDEVPDVMLLDIEMPRMDGFEVSKNIRTTTRWKHLPIIMITSRTGDKHRERALNLGVNRYMGKPYQEEQLLEEINALVGTGISQT